MVVTQRQRVDHDTTVPAAWSANARTLIAALLPPGTVTTHTLFCLKSVLDEEAQQFVVGMLNSFVANYLVRLRVSTHVTVAIVERLPLPKPPRASPDFQAVVACARTLAARGPSVEVEARLQAAAARLYGLDAAGFAHVLATLPLVDQALRTASLEALTRTI